MSFANYYYQLGLEYTVYDNRELWNKDKLHNLCVFKASFNVNSGPENLNLTLSRAGFFFCFLGLGKSRGGGDMKRHEGGC